MLSAGCYRYRTLRKGLIEILRKKEAKDCLSKYAQLGETYVEYVLKLFEAVDYPPDISHGKKLTRAKKICSIKLLENLIIFMIKVKK